MMIDVNKIKDAIFSGTSKEASEITGVPKRTIDNYRASETAVNHRNWRGISLDKAMEIMDRLKENEITKTQRRYDLRTKEYLDGIKANHGLTGIVTDHTDADFVSFKEEMLSNGDIVKIGQITDGHWCASIPVEASEDTYMAKYYFDRMPTLFSFKTMQKINELGLDFVSRKLYEEYTCNYCYKHVDHWLDYDGSLDSRMEALHNQRCGACQSKKINNKKLEEKEMNLEKIKEMLAEGKYLYFTADTGANAEKDALQSARNILGDGELKLHHLGQYEGQDDEELQIFDGDNVYYFEKNRRIKKELT